MPTPEEVGILEVNKQYQEVIKIVINLVTASLVLPIVFLKNILGVTTGIKAYLKPWAYWSWSLLVVSLCFCVLFYFFSAKLTKAIYKGVNAKYFGISIEKCRDVAALVAVPASIGGLICLLIFFWKQLGK
jgi:hypothetical protein